jgi:hypothetical protein
MVGVCLSQGITKKTTFEVLRRMMVGQAYVKY